MEILCFCHLRWDFVFQRPQHLLTRFGRRGRVHFWEEPRFETIERATLVRSERTDGVITLTPILPHGGTRQGVIDALRKLLDEYIEEQEIAQMVSWYYTPMALVFSGHLTPAVTVYDCMDELLAFQGAPPELREQENRLFQRADVVFVGGASLFASKRSQHRNAHLFPSSIDREHFAAARQKQQDPADQNEIPHPRIGFYGVLDERLDCDLLRDLAVTHPDWHLVLVGPVVKISEDKLPRAANLHYIGPKSYLELPRYLAGWDMAMLPFARNDSTQFISPTKTPEYLAGGKQVISTPIRDVVSPYGDMKLVKIGGDADEFAEAISRGLVGPDKEWLSRVDDFLALNSWDQTFEQMWEQIERVTPQSPASVDIQFAQQAGGANANV